MTECIRGVRDVDPPARQLCLQGFPAEKALIVAWHGSATGLGFLGEGGHKMTCLDYMLARVG